MHRVVITGVGTISGLGPNLNDSWNAALSGKTAIGQLDIPSIQPLRQKLAAQIHSYKPEDHFSAGELALIDRFSQFIILSGREAIADSGIDFSTDIAEETAVLTGSGLGGWETINESAKKIFYDQKPRVHPFTIPKIMPSAGSSHLTMEYGITGPAFTISSACSSSGHAIGEAFEMVRRGRVKAAVTGGGEAPLIYGGIIPWQALRVMSSTACRPFCKDRDGMILGEGAGMLVLEEYEYAKSRGARIYGELCGYGLSSDAGDIVDPSPDGAAKSVRKCLVDAQLNPEDVTYINAHGTGTTANDRTETSAIRQVFGSAVDDVWVSSTKSLHGHALGGAGAIELALTVRALESGILPPTVNFTEADEECQLRHVANEPVETKVKAVISNSFAFGGLNATLAIKAI
jgi:nodulation protein E